MRRAPRTRAPARPRDRRSQRDRRPAAVGPEHDDAAGRGGRARGPVRGARADPARAADRPAARPHPRRAGAVGGLGGPGLGRRAADRRAQARPREGRTACRRTSPRRCRRRRHTRSSPGSRRARRPTSSHFAPALEHLLELQQRYIACFDDTGEFAHPYDILLDDYEPGLTTEELRGLFTHIQRELVPLVSAAAAAGEDGRVFPGHFPTERQQPFAQELLQAVGYNAEHWRLDSSVHPFARSMAHTDVRLTTRWEPDDLAVAFYACLHEFGHGLYEAQMRPRTTGRRSPTPPGSAPTSPRAGCGRTSSAAASPSPSGSCRSCSATSGTRSTPGTSMSSTAPSTRSGSP